MAYSEVHCVVCGERMERLTRGLHHVCDPKLINKLEGQAKSDPSPPTTQSWAARLSQGFHLLNSY